MNKNHHEGIISKGQFGAVQLEMELRSNVEIGEDGKARRKSKKYSSKKGDKLWERMLNIYYCLC